MYCTDKCRAPRGWIKQTSERFRLKRLWAVTLILIILCTLAISHESLLTLRIPTIFAHNIYWLGESMQERAWSFKLELQEELQQRRSWISPKYQLHSPWFFHLLFSSTVFRNPNLAHGTDGVYHGLAYVSRMQTLRVAHHSITDGNTYLVI